MHKLLQNWSQNVSFSPKQILVPKTEAEIAAIVKTAREQQKNVRVGGSRHSFTRLLPTDDIFIDLSHFDKILDLDLTQGWARVQAGIRIKKLGDELLKKGAAIQNQGDIDVQTISGAINTGTHGTGLDFGNLATFVLEFTIVNGKGEVLICSPTQNANLFHYGRIALGTMGIVTEYKIRIIPAYKLRLDIAPCPMEDALQNFDQNNNKNRNYEFYYMIHSQIAMQKTSNISTAPPKENHIGNWLNDVILENSVFWTISRLCQTFPSLNLPLSRWIASMVSKHTKNNWAHKVYSTVRWVKFREIEYNIPYEHFEPCIRAIIARIEEKKYPTNFPIECRAVAADDIPLSPAFGRKSAYIAVHTFYKAHCPSYFADIERIFQQYEGRPHWGKENTCDKTYFQKMYPEFDNFNHQRQEADPDGIFLNEYLRKIFVNDK